MFSCAATSRTRKFITVPTNAELIYGIPGVSRLALDAIFQRDFPVMTAFVLIGAVMLVLANLVIDIAYTIIDPRIRLN